jgi:YVTN family beta-propeller protein
LKHWILSAILLAVAVLFIAQPTAAADHPLLLVVDRQANELFFVHAETFKVLESIRTGTMPQTVAVSPDGKTAFVANHNDHRNTIMVVDIEERLKIKDIKPTPAWKPHDMAITRDGKRLFVTCEASRAVAEMDIASGKFLRQFDTNEKLSHMLALSPDEKTIYTANAANGTVVIIDVEEGKRKGSLRSGNGCEGIAISPDGLEVWATNRRSETIAIIDTQSRKVLERIECRGYPIRVEFTPDGKRALVSCAELNYINVFDAETHESIDVVRTNPVPVGIAISPDGKRAFTANNGEPSVTVIDLDELRPIESFRLGKYPMGIAYVPATDGR